MINLIKEEVLNMGDRAEIISVEQLPEIIAEVKNIKDTGWLNNFQNFIVDNIYDFTLPETDFKINSIIIVATPSKLFNLTFINNGKKVSTYLPPTYYDYDSAHERVEKYLGDLLTPHGYHISFAPRLPRKILACKSGLSKYGRNNITYVDGMGSFYQLVTLYSDIPCDKKDLFEIAEMNTCKTCTLCLQNCPTKAILKDRYLINNERCLTGINESGADDFPEWIDKSAHNSIYGCVKCQIVCPHNRNNVINSKDTVEFTEEETLSLLNSVPFDEFNEDLKKKIMELNMKNYLSAIPRNLNALFQQNI